MNFLFNEREIIIINTFLLGMTEAFGSKGSKLGAYLCRASIVAILFRSRTYGCND